MHNEQDTFEPASVTGLTSANGAVNAVASDPPEEITLASAMTAVTKEINSDTMYAWSWWCNLIVPMMELGIDRPIAEQAANTFMKNAFKYDMMATDFYKEDTARREAAFAAGGGIVSTGSMDYPDDVVPNGEEAQA